MSLTTNMLTEMMSAVVYLDTHTLRSRRYLWQS